MPWSDKSVVEAFLEQSRSGTYGGRWSTGLIEDRGWVLTASVDPRGEKQPTSKQQGWINMGAVYASRIAFRPMDDPSLVYVDRTTVVAKKGHRPAVNRLIEDCEEYGLHVRVVTPQEMEQLTGGKVR